MNQIKIMGLKLIKNETPSMDPVLIKELTSLASYTLIAREALVSRVSIKGLTLHVQRESFVPIDFKENLRVHSLIGEKVVFYLPQMNLDMEGTITNVSSVEKGVFEIFVSFNNHVPKYWKECLLELFPKI